MSSRGMLQLHTTFLDLLLESANIVNDSHEAEMSNFKKSCQKSSCQRCKGILTEYACGLEGLCMGKWWWSFVSHKWVILKNENGTLHVAGSQLDTINPRKYKAHGGGGGGLRWMPSPPSSPSSSKGNFKKRIFAIILNLSLAVHSSFAEFLISQMVSMMNGTSMTTL